MTKITPEHLARAAFIYIRQSTNDQVLNNHESRRRQYALADRARALHLRDVLGGDAVRAVHLPAPVHRVSVLALALAAVAAYGVELESKCSHDVFLPALC